ncbi:hypothetical protein MDAP_001101 [Mitosporidium daphniae]
MQTPSSSERQTFSLPSTYHTRLEESANETIQKSKMLLEKPLPEALDFSSYAPKNISSDLHRRILPKLTRLDEMTDDKIKELVRERLASTTEL